MKQPVRILFFILSVLVVTAFAWALRMRAVEMLPIDYDEDDYLGAAQRYAQAIRNKDLQFIVDYDFNYEHPPLTKLVYAFSILGLSEVDLIPERPPTDPPASALPEPHFKYARSMSASLGTLETFALALLNPLAGLLLGIHTWQIKYTSQIMLEPLPALTSLLTILFYDRARKNGLSELVLGKASDEGVHIGKRVYFWLALSALALGITAASKYTYAIVGLVIIVDLFWDLFNYIRDYPSRKASRSWGRILFVLISWGVIAILIFWAFNPRLWTDPLGRLQQSVFYHAGYAQSDQVVETGFPSWQQLVWLAGPVPWHPGVFVISLDFSIFAFAIVGFPQFWRRYRVFALWLSIAGVFLLLWPTKWPQYLLTLSAPLCLSSAVGLRSVFWDRFNEWLQNRRKLNSATAQEQILARGFRKVSWRELRKARLWLLPGAVTLALIAFYPMIYQSAMALTDFSSTSMRDGIQGGIWRAAWQGLTGQEEAIEFDPFERLSSTEVHYTGPSILLALVTGALPDLLVFNLLWTGLSVLLQTMLGVVVALILHRPGVFGRGFWRTVFILPWAIPEFVGALIWLRLLDPERGWLAVAKNAPTTAFVSGFLDNPDKTLLLLLTAATWYGFPFIMLAATAGLKLIPGDVYEAAAIDGAGSWGRFRYITWPLLFPLVMPAILIRSIFAFNQFYLFYVMQVDFPTITFATLSYNLFAPGYFGGRFGVSAAINVFTVLILVVLILWFNRLSRAAEGVTYA